MFENWFPQDMTTLRKLLWFRTAWEKSGKPPTPSDPLNTFAGSIVRFFSHRALPVVKLEANFTPIQSGTGDPSPDNIRPISGHTGCDVVRTGKNLLPTQELVKTGSTYYIGGSNYYFLLKAGTYAMSEVGTKAYLYWRKKGTSDNNVIHAQNANEGTFTLTEDCEVRFWYYTSAADPSFTNIMLNLGSTAEPYEPYSGTTVSISFGTTVYGGKLTVFEDGSGQIDVDHFLYVYDGTEPFNKSSSALNGFYNNLQSYQPHDWPVMANYSSILQIADEISSMFTMTKDGNAYKQNYGYCYLDSGMNFNVPPEIFGTTTDSFKTKLAELYAAGTPVSVWAKIKTPFTIPLTASQINTLVGENVVWVNDATGDITVQAYGTEIT